MEYDCSVTNRKGCNYCNSSKSLHYDKDGVISEIYIESDKTLSVTHPLPEFSVNIKINYCPICGKKLVKNEDKS